MQFKLWLEAEIRRSKHIPYEHDILTISLPYNVFVNSVKKPITIERDIEIKEKGQIDFYMPGRLIYVELTDENNEVIDNVYFRLDSEFYSGDDKLHPSSAIPAFENNEPVF